MKKLSSSILWMLFSVVIASAQASGFYEVAGGTALQNAGYFNSGVAIADYNKDGWDDIYLSVRNGTNRLLRNLTDGTFAEVAGNAGIDYPGDTRVSCWGDINNDGFPDLYLGNNDAPDVLYINNGDNTFTDISLPAGIDNGNRPFSVLFADVDLDGWLDIYIANFRKQNVLYRNNQDLTFTDITFESGAWDLFNAMGSVFFDYDKDGDQDLYLVHDGQPNLFYENDGNGVFTDISKQAGVDDPGQGMGVDVADINRDGWLDLYVTNLYENVLYLNKGDGTFTDVSEEAGVQDYGMGWGINFLDYDNDGWVDIYVGNDSYFSPYPNVLYHNQRDTSFVKVGIEESVSSKMATYGTAVLDYNLDGQLDLFACNAASRDKNQLFRNGNQNDYNWVVLELLGTESNRNAIGAKVTLFTSDGQIQYDEVVSASSYASQSTPFLHFGLGTALPDSVEISWPSGALQKVTTLQPNFYYKIEEGRAAQVRDVVVQTIEHSDTKPKLRVYPNPVFDKLQLEFPGSANPLYTIRLYTATGQLVREWSGKGGALTTLSVGDIPVGSYFLNVYTGEEELIFLVQKAL